MRWLFHPSFRQFSSFAAVGAVGFMADAGIFFVLSKWLGLPIILSRALAFVPATLVTWSLNRLGAFKSFPRKHTNKGRQYVRYIMIQSCGMGVNFAVFILLLPVLPPLNSIMLLPLAAGSIAALAFNFIGAKFFVFLE
jgi:putative flippase GtrA